MREKTGLTDGVRSIFLKNKTNIDIQNEFGLIITPGSLFMCGGDRACRAPPSACSLMFWFSWDVSG